MGGTANLHLPDNADSLRYVQSASWWHSASTFKIIGLAMLTLGKDRFAGSIYLFLVFTA